jgi:hypothetical protein
MKELYNMLKFHNEEKKKLLILSFHSDPYFISILLLSLCTALMRAVLPTSRKYGLASIFTVEVSRPVTVYVRIGC